MTEIVETKLKLNEAALKYIHWCLEEGPTFSKLLLGIVEFVQGRLSAFLPSGIIPEDAQKFKEGGKVLINTIEDIHTLGKRNLLAMTVKNFLDEHSSHICIVQDYLSKANDPIQQTWQQHWKLPGEVKFWQFENEVYYLLFSGDDLEYIYNILRFAESTSPFIGALSSGTEALISDFKRKKILLHNDLMVLAERAEKVFFSVYDGESYLIWHRQAV